MSPNKTIEEIERLVTRIEKELLLISLSVGMYRIFFYVLTGDDHHLLVEIEKWKELSNSGDSWIDRRLIPGGAEEEEEIKRNKRSI